MIPGLREHKVRSNPQVSEHQASCNSLAISWNPAGHLQQKDCLLQFYC